MAAQNLHQQIRRSIEQMLSRPGSDAEVLQQVLRLLAKYRVLLIQNTLIALHGTSIRAGPFAGMAFVQQSSEGCHVPKLLGCYEEELHDTIRALKARRYDSVLNIGCAEGYYAVGLKRFLGDVAVFAFDRDPKARQACRALAEKNGVVLEIGGEFTHADFARFEGRVLVWCDIEGAEVALLDPERASALRRMDVVAELHRTVSGHASDIVPQRFAASHDVEILATRNHHPELPEFLQRLGHLDQLLAQWEWRSEPTPWAVMWAKDASRA